MTDKVVQGSAGPRQTPPTRGTLSRLSRHALDDFTGGYRTALAVLAGVCVLGMVLSLARNAGLRPAPRRRPSPG